MGMLYMDGFEFRGNDGNFDRWGWEAYGGYWLSKTTGRGAVGLCAQLERNYYARKNVAPASNTIIFCFGYYVVTALEDREICAFREGATDHVTVGMDASGNLIAKRGSWSGGTTLGTSSGATLTTGAWHWVEVKMTLDDSTGAVEIRLNDTQILNLTSVDTNNGTSPGAIDNLGIGSSGYGGTNNHLFDDVVMLDDTGSDLNTFLTSAATIVQFAPTADGDYDDFTPSSGADNYATVDEGGWLGDYNASATVGHTDTMEIGSVAAGVTGIKAVKVSQLAQLDGAGSRGLSPVICNGSGSPGDVLVGDEQTLTSSQVGFSHIFTVDPATGSPGSPWTVSDFNAHCQIGYRITS